MNDLDLIHRIQAAYPRIYLACHADHASQSSATLSQRDATILAHLDRATPLTQAQLARHLDVTKSTMSEALRHLAGAGYVTVTDAPDRRAHHVLLTEAGRDAMSACSVLRTDRLAALLARLDDKEREQAVAGLELLARAATIQEESA